MKVMIYEVKKGANKNFKTLYKGSSFYWNPDKFGELSVEDRVFVVNKNYIGNNNNHSNGIVLFCKIISTNIEVNKGDKIIDGDIEIEIQKRNNKNWNSPFYKFEVITSIPFNDNKKEWKALGTQEVTTLYSEDLSFMQNISTIKNNLQRVKFLRQLFENNNEASNILRKSYNFLQSLLSKTQQDYKNTNQILDKEEREKDKIIKKILIATQTKPFVILAGLSGIGKSRLVRTIAYKTCPSKLGKGNMPGNFELIPVRPNWHDSSELLGYISRINGEKYVVTNFLMFLAKAWRNLDTPFFLLLDEMNLAPVEHYFAEYLSVIETRRKINENNKEKIITDPILSKSEIGGSLYEQLLEDLNLKNIKCCEDSISIPQNFIVIGTVNMDETTHSFSKKVLDRAMTLEISDVDLEAGLDENINDWNFSSENKIIPLQKIKSEFVLGSEVWGEENFNEKEEIIKKLKEINRELKNTPFIITYRARDEILIYCYHAKSLYSRHNSDTTWIEKALNDVMLMKVIPKIEGDESKTEDALKKLKRYFECGDSNSNYKKLCEKIEEMEILLKKAGYTSFWR